MSDEDTENFNDAQNCYLCNEPLGVDRIRYHDLTGTYRGAAHNQCNLQLQFKKDVSRKCLYIPLIFHNLRALAVTLSLRQLPLFPTELVRQTIQIYKSCQPRSFIMYLDANVK
jgi:hypothetical protein